MHTELTVMRLRWFQSLLKSPEHHEQYFTALFALYDFEQSSHAQFAIAQRPHKWVLQLQSDIQQLGTLDNWSYVVEDIGNNPQCLLVDVQLRDAFRTGDVSELRNKHISKCIPPPGTTLTSSTCSPCSAVPSSTFTCGDIRIDGSHCEATFSTYRELCVHRRKATTTHDSPPHVQQLAVTNQCPFCSSSFSSLLSARQHVRHAVTYGACHVDRSYMPIPVKQVTDISCIVCNNSYANVDQYNWHVTLHHQHLHPVAICFYSSPIETQQQFIGRLSNFTADDVARLSGVTRSTPKRKHVLCADNIGSQHGRHDVKQRLRRRCRNDWRGDRCAQPRKRQAKAVWRRYWKPRSYKRREGGAGKQKENEAADVVVVQAALTERSTSSRPQGNCPVGDCFAIGQPMDSQREGLYCRTGKTGQEDQRRTDGAGHCKGGNSPNGRKESRTAPHPRVGRPGQHSRSRVPVEGPAGQTHRAQQLHSCLGRPFEMGRTDEADKMGADREDTCVDDVQAADQRFDHYPLVGGMGRASSSVDSVPRGPPPRGPAPPGDMERKIQEIIPYLEK